MRATPVDVRLHRIPKHLKLHVADEKLPMRYHNQKLTRNLTGEVSDITTESIDLPSMRPVITQGIDKANRPVESAAVEAFSTKAKSRRSLWRRRRPMLIGTNPSLRRGTRTQLSTIKLF